jgi:HlyD family secretion protein
MDKQRSNGAQRKRRRRLLIGLGLAGVALLFAAAAFLLQPAAPSVSRESVWIGEARRGPLEVKVSGFGTFVPRDQRWITAQTSGTVERIVLLPGARVEPDSVIMELSNPELRQALRNVELELASAQARLANERAREEDALLELEYLLAQLQANFENAALDVRVNDELYAEGLVAEREVLRSRVAEEQWRRQRDILARRLASRREQMEQNLAPALANVSQQEERVTLLARQVDELKVRAGVTGILQRLPREEGEQVSPGTQLAQVSDPSRLKAVIRISETQAKDLAIGQPGLIDNHNGTVRALVARIDPAVQGGQVEVDLHLEGELPPGARADQSIEGQIELDRLPDVVFIRRPSIAREFASVGLFVLDPAGSGAVRREVTFGRGSVSEIEVRAGLEPGERVILSETSRWDENDRLRLN